MLLDHRILKAALLLCSTQLKPVFLILDGMDECPSHLREKILEFGKEFTVSGGKVFLTTQPYVLDELLQGTASSLAVEIIANESDIRDYVEHNLATQRYGRELVNKVKDAIAKESNGM